MSSHLGSKSPSAAGNMKVLGDANAAKFFGFSPKDFTGQLYDEIDNQIADAVDAFDEEISKRTSMNKTLIQKSSDDVLTLLHETIDENVDKFEIYVLRNIFVVPDGLPTQTTANDAMGDSPSKRKRPSAPADEKELDQDCRRLTTLLKKKKTVRQNLEKQRLSLNTHRKRLQNIVDTLSEIDSDLDASFVGQLKSILEQSKHLAQSNEQLQELEEVLLRKRNSSSQDDTSKEQMAKNFQRHRSQLGGLSQSTLKRSIFR